MGTRPSLPRSSTSEHPMQTHPGASRFSAMPDFLPAMPHGPITEVFPDVFVVEGGFQFAPGVRITRNMTVVRQGDELTIINSVRLTPDGEAELEKLGRVKHVVRIGAFHGADDPYYVDR